MFFLSNLWNIDFNRKSACEPTVYILKLSNEKEAALRLYLIRHGEANPVSIDPSRTLTAKGVDDAVTVGKFLSSLHVNPDCIFSSDKSRAIKTAGIISSILECSDDRVIASRELNPNAYPEGMCSLVTSYGPADTVIIVGHMPSIGLLTSYLITSDRTVDASISFETCGVAYLEGDNLGKPGGFILRMLLSPTLI